MKTTFSSLISYINKEEFYFRTQSKSFNVKLILKLILELILKASTSNRQTITCGLFIVILGHSFVCYVVFYLKKHNTPTPMGV